MTTLKRVAVLILVSSFTALAAPLTVGPAEASFHPVRISGAQYNSPGSDTGSNYSLNAEWVKIHNYGSTAKSLSGWTLRDTSNHVYRFGTFKLRAGHTVRIHTGKGTNTSTDRCQGGAGMSGTTPTTRRFLKNSAGTTVSVRSW